MTDRADPSSEVAAVIVAAGRGQRAGSAEGPKQYRPLAGRAVVARTLDRMRAAPRIGRTVVVIHWDDRALLDAACDITEGMIVVTGGETRQQSVLRGLEALAGNPPGFVLIQDGARPFSDAALIGRVIDALDADHGAIAAMPVADTLKRETESGLIRETVSRAGLWAAQTPQGFPFAPILAAHRKAERENRFDFTDDAAIAEWASLPVRLVPGSPDNTKLTWARDIELAEKLMQEPPFPDVRTGTGYDVHAFVPGEAVTLCGVVIPFDRRLSGHSDADAPLHALTDALLATCGEGDIGTHFPPSDPQWKGVASRRFVEHAASLVRARGGRIANADISVIAEAPKVGPHRAAMVAAIAGMLGIEAARVSVKATTNERMGFVGREEGIAALATVSVVYPGSLPA